MKPNRTVSHIPRRTLLACAGAAAAGTFLRPLFAAAAGAAPTRLLIVHRPCGTRPEQFFPQAGDNTNFTLTPILQSFEKLRDSMVILNQVSCPRDTGWVGDQHAAGMIGMLTGKRAILTPGADGGGDQQTKFIVGADQSIDQLLVSKVAALQGTPIPSLQATAYQPSSVGLPSFKVMSYSGPNGAMFPESQPSKLFGRVFGDALAGLSPAALAQLRLQNQGVLDFMHKDLSRLRARVPASQLSKLDAHLEGLSQLDKAAAETGAGATCAKPMQLALPAAMGGVSADEAQHLAVARNQLALIAGAFQCDLTRVATFSFAHGNSGLRFSQMASSLSAFGVPTEFADGSGHHSLSHETGDGPSKYQARVEQFYCAVLAQFLETLKATPDGDGSLLDHTLVVFLNEVSLGASHSINDMPVLMFGGKSLKLQGGKHLRFGDRYMNDVWAAVAGAFGAPASFGDAAFSKGPVSDLIG